MVLGRPANLGTLFSKTAVVERVFRPAEPSCAVNSVSALRANTFTAVISPLVRVPVLSEQTTLTFCAARSAFSMSLPTDKNNRTTSCTEYYFEKAIFRKRPAHDLQKFSIFYLPSISETIFLRPAISASLLSKYLEFYRASEKIHGNS